ncbi:stage II sporulation protein P [Paenibacillus sp. LHD-117]|uniref:stage II sporulation protein P n=1 Tax=Paenibacillus sp. LHD-117 TaxID=3071412 RepID=UPI0027E05BAC|nr:stage II sporulation protein P [Paenibacillus sp. LHD-117]MDQ6419326.1 stage II sporulation protein P [Paenibacillus sp. LHD-117]
MKLRNAIMGGAAAIMLLSGVGDVADAATVRAGSTLAADAESSQDVWKQAKVVHIVAVTNLRKGPGMDYKVVAKAQAGDSFTIEGIEGDWFQVALPRGGKAYVANWVVETDAPEQVENPGSGGGQQADNSPAATTVHIVGVTNLRSGPGMDYSVVAKAQSGDTFRIDGSEGEWYRIVLTNGGKAYVAKWVVQTGEVPDSDSKVYIYHSHNRESWKNVARNTGGNAYDDKEINITLVGKHLADVLEQRGISSIAENADIAARLTEQNLNYSQSYAESGKAVANAISAYASLSYFLDIHRDSDVPRSATTVTIGKTTYARVMFVIGTANPKYKENKKLADALNALLNKKYPGLSRGVLLKGSNQGNGAYNQSVSSGSLLLEFGGVNNTLQENLSTAEAFADVFADYLKK